jgi:hypothetical protein
LRTSEVCAGSTKSKLLRTGQSRKALPDRGRGRLQIGLRRKRRHVLGRGQRAEARLYILIRSAKTSSDIRHRGTASRLIKIAKADAKLTNARGNALSGQRGVLHRALGVRKLSSSVCASKDVRRFGSCLDASVNSLICCLYVRHVGADTELLCRAHRRQLSRREAGYLIGRKLLRKRGRRADNIASLVSLDVKRQVPSLSE